MYIYIPTQTSSSSLCACLPMRPYAPPLAKHNQAGLFDAAISSITSVSFCEIENASKSSLFRLIHSGVTKLGISPGAAILMVFYYSSSPLPPSLPSNVVCQVFFLCKFCKFSRKNVSSFGSKPLDGVTRGGGPPPLTVTLLLIHEL